MSRSAVGSLMYMICSTWPDLFFAVCACTAREWARERALCVIKQGTGLFHEDGWFLFQQGGGIFFVGIC